ncbi:4Fe-4S ferredoxin iron-sulfur binding domain protein [Methanothermus fervidus DSM 2088]|uniref:4Fe-4S ferredoxin iron-sulfur binding domain protein n=1 Tax=Methanothermus fervidus (strain ATCC 43054 / DSM 2088 / JCM 10308 / V24 S) TaxID=523846 RepID=E3GXN5_METFV|nr:4Fe-4S dicluster domain-containing protein [Methanothermus fervidus]ADP77067.1 4Fe-4S ferredoxin iron-sulfur binding domain protein [Methanothermus fervidus DSM 2088]
MKRIVIKPELCKGCSMCMRACMKVQHAPNISVKKIDGEFRIVVCHHCKNAPCVEACPTGAMKINYVDTDKCIGCGSCALECPFGAISIKNNVAHKCNLCDNLDYPACVRACPTKALTLIDVEKFIKRKKEEYLNKIKKVGSYTILDVLKFEVKAKKNLESSEAK